ncbi:MAG: AAA family ATPase, partial [Bacteroidota bacterium]
GALDYKLVVSPHDNQIMYLKEGKKLTLLPYETLSDSLKRFLFYLAMVRSNEGASILLEEPDSHTFPHYTNEIAEMIAKDDTNQYFIVTHNPFLLGTLLDKTPAKDLQVNIAYREDFATRFYQLKAEEEYSELMMLDEGMMLNLERFYEADFR